MTHLTIKSYLFILLFFLFACSSYQEEQIQTETQIDKMEWWREARFGMFIHWGLYAIPAGEWKGEKIPGISEWIMYNAQIPVGEYKALAKDFNPVNYDADKWVQLAKEAGMKYIVITTKHHDGFAMFHSKADSFNIVDATPFTRDPIQELAEACKKYDIQLGFYYSQAQDWTHPGGTFRGIDSLPHWDPSVQPVAREVYLKEKAIPQVEELLSNYGEVAIIWWDTPAWAAPKGVSQKEYGEMFMPLLEKQEGILMNNRLVWNWNYDFRTPEQNIPPTGLDYDWESCMTMNTSWGYKHYDNHWKSTQKIVRNLVDIASKGGNYLLNVGPNALGEIPDPSIKRLQGIGAWMQQNGESIYGTTASPFFKLFWGRCTQKQLKDKTILYLHVFDWPKDGKLLVPGLMTEVDQAYALVGNQKLTTTQEEGNLIVNLPDKPIDEISSTIVLEMQDSLVVKSNLPIENKNGQIHLPAIMCDIHNEAYDAANQAEIYGFGAEDTYIKNWVHHQVKLGWMFHSLTDGAYQINAKISSSSNTSSLIINCNGQKIEAKIPYTGGLDLIQEVHLGTIELPKGEHFLELKPIKEGWKELKLYHVGLNKVQTDQE